MLEEEGSFDLRSYLCALRKSISLFLALSSIYFLCLWNVIPSIVEVGVHEPMSVISLVEHSKAKKIGRVEDSMEKRKETLIQGKEKGKVTIIKGSLGASAKREYILCKSSSYCNCGIWWMIRLCKFLLVTIESFFLRRPSDKQFNSLALTNGISEVFVRWW